MCYTGRELRKGGVCVPVVKGLETAFNTVCAAYDRWRPGYPPELYADIFACCPLGAGSSALEIGIGTGQATAPILDAGAAVTAVELGDRLSAFVREKFAGRDLRVINARFEETSLPGGSFDLIYATSAFHWIPEEFGYREVFRLLKIGGVFARFANHPYRDREHPALWEAIQELYAFYMPGSRAADEYTEKAARSRAETAGKYGFADISWQLYRRTRRFTGEEYAALLGTYSDHLALEEGKRREFFAAIRRVIEQAGGQIAICDTVDLALARKP